jgi:hypothetical protein
MRMVVRILALLSAIAVFGSTLIVKYTKHNSNRKCFDNCGFCIEVPPLPSAQVYTAPPPSSKCVRTASGKCGWVPGFPPPLPLTTSPKKGSP